MGVGSWPLFSSAYRGEPAAVSLPRRNPQDTDQRLARSGRSFAGVPLLALFCGHRACGSFGLCNFLLGLLYTLACRSLCCVWGWLQGLTHTTHSADDSESAHLVLAPPAACPRSGRLFGRSTCAMSRRPYTSKKSHLHHRSSRLAAGGLTVVHGTWCLDGVRLALAEASAQPGLGAGQARVHSCAPPRPCLFSWGGFRAALP